MDDEVTRLRALCEGIALPWMAQPTIVDGDEIECSALVLCPYGDDGDRDMVAEIDMGHGVERDDAHAALIVAAVNALPALLDRVEAAEARVAELEARVAELEARVAELEARGLALGSDALTAYAQRREMGREAQRLREIIAGRTTPPTDAEIAAHDADGGVWLLTWEHDGKLCADATRTLAQVRAYAASRPGEYAYRWHAIGRDGRPCAWPVVTEVSRG